MKDKIISDLSRKRKKKKEIPVHMQIPSANTILVKLTCICKMEGRVLNYPQNERNTTQLL